MQVTNLAISLNRSRLPCSDAELFKKEQVHVTGAFRWILFRLRGSVVVLEAGQRKALAQNESRGQQFAAVDVMEDGRWEKRLARTLTPPGMVEG